MKKVFFLSLFLVAAVFHLAAQEKEPWFVREFGDELTSRTGNKVNTATVLQGKRVGLYFSALWCGPCRAFTPQLVKFYKRVARKSNLEIVFISSDKSPVKMMEYMKTDSMPWLAVPFDSLTRTKLKKKFRVNGIPRLIILDENGKVISENARWDVVLLGPNAVKEWDKANYKPLTYKDYMSKREKRAPRKKKRK
ncbi:MAG: redoxin family protein [Lentisphaeria bacterium]|nr:redoxin family protein [Lentisphaeria bacterium]